MKNRKSGKFLLIALLGLLMGFSGITYAQNEWNNKADFAGAFRFAAVGFSIGDRGYVGTGHDASGVDRNDFWEYNPATNQWTQRANFPGAARSSAAGFAIGNKGYIGTGISGFTHYRDFYEYDPATNMWTQKANMGGNPVRRCGATGFSVNGKGYIATGVLNFFEVKNELFEYDPVADVWAARAALPAGGREGAISFGIGTKGYVGTGRRVYQDYSMDFYNDLWEWDQETDTWTQKADVPGEQRANAFAYALGGKGYVGTGNGANDDLRDFYEFDPAGNKWVAKREYKGGLVAGAVAFAIGDKGYAGTGSDGNIRGDFYEYTSGMTPIVITIGNIQQPLCIGDSVFVPFTVTGDVPDGNNFILQLSSTTGAFSPTAILAFQPGTTSGVMKFQLQSSIAPGTTYRMRVVSNPTVSTSSVSPFMSIYASPSVSYVSSFADVCGDDAVYELNGGSPGGGVYEGNGVFNQTNFDPDLAGVGTHPIKYIYTDANGCSRSASQDLRVQDCTDPGTDPNSISGAILNPFKFSVFPNPYQGYTNIKYTLSGKVKTLLEVKNMLGQTIKILEDGYQLQGDYLYGFSAEELGLPVGVYLVNLMIDDQMFVSKIIEY
ncbi:MAG: T9SS type A sorting domain-containing protein [Cytophagaceae bacterium]